MFLNAFKNLFTSKNTNKLSKKGIRRRLELLGLEERVVPATITVTNTNDTGANSLRQAIIDANTSPANDIIDFNFATGSSPYTITLASALPNILDASTAGTLTINGLGASSLTISGNQGNFSIFSIDTGADLTISGVTVTGANIAGYGGGFYNKGTLNVSSSTISGNYSPKGGAIYNSTNSFLTVNNSTLSGNTAAGGGGIFNNGGTIIVSNSTLSGNTAAGGGGIYNYNGTFSVTNSTLSGNTASFSGGGIFNIATLTVSNSTLSGNSATNNGGGIFNGGILNLTNTIIANSISGGDYAGSNNSTVNVTSPSTAANNLVSQGLFTWATTKTSAEINLGPLANNGGPTQTLALLAGSVAIGAGNATISNTAPVNGLDQRGINRKTSDIGAYSFGIQVTTTADSGAGSLRAAITLANTTPGDDQISFNLTGSSTYTITLATALPNIVDANAVVGAGTAGTVNIAGLGASSLTIDANQGNFSIFYRYRC